MDPRSTTFYLHAVYSDGAPPTLQAYSVSTDETTAHAWCKFMASLSNTMLVWLHNGYGAIQSYKGTVNGIKPLT